jgi:hypothetical protein
MKINSFLSIFLLAFSAGIFCSNTVYSQEGVPTEVASIVNMKLEDGQKKLKDLGYEICYSSLTGKKQDWYNEKTNNCVTVLFAKKEHLITEVAPNPEVSECQKRYEESQKVWEKYHDGQAPVSSTKLDEERKKLAEQGFVVSYWIDDVSPGRCSEYWVNTSTQKVKYVVWEVQGTVWVMTENTTFNMGTNPAPKK